MKSFVVALTRVALLLERKEGQKREEKKRSTRNNVSQLSLECIWARLWALLRDSPLRPQKQGLADEGVDPSAKKNSQSSLLFSSNHTPNAILSAHAVISMATAVHTKRAVLTEHLASHCPVPIQSSSTSCSPERAVLSAALACLLLSLAFIPIVRSADSLLCQRYRR